MGVINQTGFFKGHIVSGEFSKTKAGLPQSIWMLKATEVYDGDNQEYLSADSEADEITAFLTMYNHDDSENFNTPQIKKLTGWDGANFNDLADMDLTGLELSFQVAYGRGDYADRLGVDRIDVPDTTPGRTVAKLDKAEVDALQAKYAGVLAATKAPTKAVSAKTAKKATKKAKAKAKGRPTPPKPPKTEPVGKCTDQEAYDACYELKRDDVTEDALNELWGVEVAKVNDDEAKITEEQWFQIKETILKEIGKV